MTTLKTNYDYENEYVLFYNPYFVIADSYTVIEPGLSEFKSDQSTTWSRNISWQKRRNSTYHKDRTLR